MGLQSKLYPSTLKIEHQCIVHNTSVLNSPPLRKRKRLANNDDLGLVITLISLKRYHILKPKPSLLEAFVFCLRLFPLVSCNGAGLFNSGSPLCANLLIRARLTRGACLKEDRNQLTQKQSTPVLLPQQVNTLCQQKSAVKYFHSIYF